MSINQACVSSVQVPAAGVELSGELAVPQDATGIVLFAHGSGSSRFSPRNRFVAKKLQESRLGTLLLDLLTEDEELVDQRTRALRFDIGLLAERLKSATEWLAQDERTSDLAVGYFGASTGASAALIAATHLQNQVQSVVSRGGRPDLAEQSLSRLRAATLLIVGGKDEAVLELNKQALARLAAPVKELAIVPAATHLFEEPGTLVQVAQLAVDWFQRHLTIPQNAPASQRTT